MPAIDCNAATAASLDRAHKYRQQHLYGQAEREYRAALEVNPNCAEALWNYGLMLHEVGALPQAAKQYRNVFVSPECAPEAKANALNNLGQILIRWGHVDMARESFRIALQLCPTHCEAMVNSGILMRWDRDVVGAQAVQDQVLAREPKKPEAHCEAAFLALTTGDLLRGFKEYEWRWAWPQFSTRRLQTKRPKWNGQPLAGKTILLTHEQGLGDSFMFIRYAPMVRALGAQVHFWGPPEVIDLCASVSGVDKVFCAHDTSNDYFDYHCPLLSLPRIFKTSLKTVPGSVPYISVVDHAVLRGKFRVGLVWAGRTEHGGDRWRSMTIDQMSPLLDVPGVSWYSLQIGERANGVERFPQVIDLRPIIHNFSDTGSILNALDLLISVDTAVVHLAGALARPVWTLLPYSADWRWMLGREDSPWYPTMRLWRQEQKGDWRSVLEKVKSELAGRVR